MKLDEYNLEAYKYIRLEIENRVQTHYKMVMWKIALGGTILAFLFEKGTSLPLSPFFISAIFLLLMDIVITENLGQIRSAGYFVKKNIENFTENSSIIRWESDFAQAGAGWGCFSVQGYVMGIWIISPLLIILGILIDFDKTNNIHLVSLAINVFLLFWSLKMIMDNLGANRYIHIEDADSPIRRHHE